MRTLLAALLLTVSAHAVYGQETSVSLLRDAAGKTYLERIVPVSFVMPRDMYRRAADYVSKSLPVASTAPVYDEAREIVTSSCRYAMARHRQPYTELVDGTMTARMELRFRERRFRYILSDMVFQLKYNDGRIETLSYDKLGAGKIHSELREEARAIVLRTTDELEQTIRTGAAEPAPRKEEW